MGGTSTSMDRQAAARALLENQPCLLIATPIYTSCAARQGTKEHAKDMSFVVKLIRIQTAIGGYSLVERPKGAAFWNLPEVQSMLRE